jgi:hypothetical protein
MTTSGLLLSSLLFPQELKFGLLGVTVVSTPVMTFFKHSGEHPKRRSGRDKFAIQRRR